MIGEIRHGIELIATDSNVGVTRAGDAGDNVLTGGSGQDFLYGNDGNDVLEGGAGRDYLHGGNGVDTAVFAGNASNFAIASGLVGYSVADTQGMAGTDTLVKIERLQFSDKDDRAGHRR